MNYRIEAQVFAFIVKQLRVRPDEVRVDRSINFDLGMDGDDAVEFFEAFADEFKVDLTELGEEWGRWFGPEGVFGIFPTASIITLFGQRQFGDLTPMPIRFIVEAACNGKWTKEQGRACEHAD